MRNELKNFFMSNPKGTQLVDALCYNYKYQENIENSLGIPVKNPVSKEDFCVEVVIGFLKDNYIAYKVNVELEETKKIVLETTTLEL